MDQISQIQNLTVTEFKAKLKDAELDAAAMLKLQNLVDDDGRSGIVSAFESEKKRVLARDKEISRVREMYEFQNQIAAMPGRPVILGLDEVGRGPLAGPLTAGGTILKSEPMILGLNDSKQVRPTKREELAQQIKEQAIFAETFSVPPKYIDELGMTECLRRAFKEVIRKAEEAGNLVDVVLLDGNPLRIDKREVNVVKGDTKCASIAAASIYAKVCRDSYMQQISPKFPQYHFDKNKGYGSAEHIKAIEENGLCAIHRRSFCTSFLQMSMF